MKKLPLFLLLILLFATTPAMCQQKTLPDGLYYANISYYNYSTFVSADYSNLKVRVRDGMVIIVHLINGSVIHYGVNNENYMYTGGKLSAHTDKHTGIVEYTTQVAISNGRNISTYSISILKESPDDPQAEDKP